MAISGVRGWPVAALIAWLPACSSFGAADASAGPDGGPSAAAEGGADADAGAPFSCDGSLYCETFDDKAALSDLEHDGAELSVATGGMTLTETVGNPARGLRFALPPPSGYFERRVLVTKTSLSTTSIAFAFDVTVTAANGVPIAGIETPYDATDTLYVRFAIDPDLSLSAEAYGSSPIPLGVLTPGRHRLAFVVEHNGCTLTVDGARKGDAPFATASGALSQLAVWYGVTGDVPNAPSADLVFDDVALGPP
jgi:hypothetical protein